MVIQHDKTDILIIGAGASGAAVMWDLSKAGFNVVCLEQGSRIQTDKYPVNHPNWEELSMNKWNYNPNMDFLVRIWNYKFKYGIINPNMEL